MLSLALRVIPSHTQPYLKIWIRQGTESLEVQVLVLTPFQTCGSLQFRSVTQSCPTLCDPMNHSMPGLPVHHQFRSLLKLMSIKSVMPSSHLILCHPLLLLSPIPPSIRDFSNESTLHMRWPNYWSFSFSITPSKGLVGSPCSPRDSQKSSPAPQFKNIISLMLSFLHSPSITFIHDHWKNHSLD